MPFWRPVLDSPALAAHVTLSREWVIKNSSGHTYLSQSIWTKFKSMLPHVCAPSTWTWQSGYWAWTALQIPSAGNRRPPTFERWENVTNFVLSLTSFMNSATISLSVVAPLRSDGMLWITNGRWAWRINQARPFVGWFCSQMTTYKNDNNSQQKSKRKSNKIFKVFNVKLRCFFDARSIFDITSIFFH